MNTYTFKNFYQLENNYIVLKRMDKTDIDELSTNLFSSDNFFALHRGLDTKEKIQKNLELSLDDSSKLILTALEKKTGAKVATSSYLNVGMDFSSVEIGFTWISNSWQRTYVNSSMKMLMIQYAFEVMKVRRLSFSVDPTNLKSNISVKKLGAQFEGTLRNWRFNSPQDCGHRNIYSIINSEFENVIENLKSKCAI